MPIECGAQIKFFEQEQFHVVDKVVMRHAFDIHNALSRFCDEEVYQEALIQRCCSAGFEVHREVTLRAVFQDFSKLYYCDMLVNGGVMYELKAAETLNRNHQKQFINYLLLAGLGHGKLLNFRSTSVESRFVSTRLRREDRNDFKLVESAWKGDDLMSRRLRDTLCALLNDWGAFLDVHLYKEALLHFLAGPSSGAFAIDVVMDDRVVGLHKMCMLDTETAWHLSAVRQHIVGYETHLWKLLTHTPLKRIQWINIDQRTVLLKTLTK